MLRAELELKRGGSLARDTGVEREDESAEGHVPEDEFLIFRVPVSAAGSAESKRCGARADLGGGRTPEVDQSHSLRRDRIVGKRSCRAHEQALQRIRVEIRARLC